MKKTRSITLRIEQKIFEKLEQLSKVDNTTLSSFLRGVLVSYLSKRDPFFVVSYSRGETNGRNKTENKTI
jgi:hypothetical protein